MSSLRQSPLPTLQSLSASFGDVQTLLEPLFFYKYEQLSSALQANSSAPALSAASDSNDELRGRLDAARMQVSAAYVLLDLVWILLKIKGIDHTSHPVMQELERVKSYFKKIQSAQAKEKEEESQPKLDKSAAGRFIRAALVCAAPESLQGKHTKFDEDTSSSSTPKKADKEEQATPKNADDSSAANTPASSSKSKKKKRLAVDPFDGYDKPSTSKQSKPSKSNDDATPSSASASAQKKTKKRSTETE
ncbi:hypothetical protein BCV70DRAFT_198867 [Testicularia cyperi]|uniref:Exosome complex protein n=1 Tax=Testicularia cyperi TaxID=1882483 RepID=A0A317XU41_9BASI|nr:hypothetical protein BCV70DRAFT_198867 [Testicularia cyperi]